MTLLLWPKDRGLQFSFLNGLPTSFTFSRASSGTYFDSAGLLRTASSGVPRFDYDPVTLAPRGILMESSRTNLSYPSVPNAGTWVGGTNATITNTGTIASPSALLDAATLTDNSTTSAHVIARNILSVTSGSVYVLSVYAKAGTESIIQLGAATSGFGGAGYVNFNLLTGVVESSGGTLVSYGISPVRNGWYRCWIVITATATTSGVGTGIYFTNTNPSAGRSPSYSGARKYFYVWGHQSELGSYPTSYIPTTSSSATRAVDALYTTSLPWFNASQGTSVTRYMLSGASSNGNNRVVHSFNDGSTNNRVTNYISVAGYDTCAVTSAGVASFDQFLDGVVSVGADNATGVSYKTDNFAGVRNGGVVRTDKSGSVPVGINRLDLGQRNNGGFSLDGWIQSFRYYNKALTSAELQRLTVV